MKYTLTPEVSGSAIIELKSVYVLIRTNVFLQVVLRRTVVIDTTWFISEPENLVSLLSEKRFSSAHSYERK